MARRVRQGAAPAVARSIIVRVADSTLGFKQHAASGGYVPRLETDAADPCAAPAGACTGVALGHDRWNGLV